METKKRYLIRNVDNNKKIDYFYSRDEAKKKINKLLKANYEGFIIKRKEEGGDFIDYWKWYCMQDSKGTYNGKLYKIIED